MPVGATVAAVGSVASAGVGALAAKSAAKTQAKSAQQASDIQLKMFNTTREDLAPYRSAGESAVPDYLKLLGIGNQGPVLDTAAYLKTNPDVMAHYNRLFETEDGRAFLAQQNINSADDYARFHYTSKGKQEEAAGGRNAATFSNPLSDYLESLPGYKFARDQGIKSITNSVGSRGQTGAQAKGIARFVTGLADSTYGEQVNRLLSAVNVGSGAASTTGQLAQQTASGVGNALIGAGQASAAGTVGAANAIGSGINNASQYYLANKVLGMYSGGGGFPAQTSI